MFDMFLIFCEPLAYGVLGLLQTILLQELIFPS